MDTDASYDYLFKVVVVGDSETGKSNLLSRYTKDMFTDEFRPTIGAEFAARNVDINGKGIKAQVWGTAGQERYIAITSAYFRGAVGAIIVYDITNRRSYEKVDKWLKELEGYAEDGLSAVLVGNKLDLASKRKVSKKEATEYAEKNNLSFVETSAKFSTNVDMAFNTLLTGILNKVSRRDQVGQEADYRKGEFYIQGEACKVAADSDTVSSPEVEERVAEIIDSDIPPWAQELFQQMQGIQERLQTVSRLENTVEKLCTKVDNLDMRMSRLETKKINFKTAQSASAKK